MIERLATIIHKPRKKIAQRQLELRARLWPGLNESFIWQRKKHDGFTTTPRTMPLMISIMDDLSEGQPVSSTYLELWCRAFDECFVTLSKPREMAFHAGFTGHRGERTWRSRMKILADLGFIDIREGPSGPLSYTHFQPLPRHSSAARPKASGGERGQIQCSDGARRRD
jgi:hypothetical protein